jgi:hypothetical protein
MRHSDRCSGRAMPRLYTLRSVAWQPLVGLIMCLVACVNTLGTQLLPWLLLECWLACLLSFIVYSEVSTSLLLDVSVDVDVQYVVFQDSGACGSGKSKSQPRTGHTREQTTKRTRTQTRRHTRRRTPQQQHTRHGSGKSE